MPAVDVDRLKDQGKHFVDGFTPGQKAMTILGVVAVVLAGMTFMKWSSSKPDYAPLYTGLSGADAGKVTQALDSAGVKWKLSDGGATMLVPRPCVDKTRIELSAQELPSELRQVRPARQGGHHRIRQFMQHIDYQRAMQGELAKTIESIDCVAAATVNLDDPARPVFVGRRPRTSRPRPCSCSRPRRRALERRGEGDRAPRRVEHPEHDPDEVTVADSSGNVLHAPGMRPRRAAQGLAAAERLRHRAGARSIETYVAHRRSARATPPCTVQPT